MNLTNQYTRVASENSAALEGTFYAQSFNPELGFIWADALGDDGDPREQDVRLFNQLMIDLGGQKEASTYRLPSGSGGKYSLVRYGKLPALHLIATRNHDNGIPYYREDGNVYYEGGKFRVKNGSSARPGLNESLHSRAGNSPAEKIKNWMKYWAQQ